MTIGFNHFSFTVSNVDTSVRHYVDNLGFTVISLADRPEDYVFSVTGLSAGMRVAYLKGQGIVLELIEFSTGDSKKPQSQPNNIGSGHICLNVDDIDATVDFLKSRGVRLLGQPVLIPVGSNKGGYVVYSLDPDGIVNEFIQAPG